MPWIHILDADRKPTGSVHINFVQGEDLDFCPLHKSQAPLTLFDAVEAGA
jgi:hypothetical protein